MNCPRCKATIGPLANPDGVVTCPGCGTRLMTRTAMLRSQGGAKAGAPTPAQGGDRAAAGKTAARDLPPDATLPATPAQMLALSGDESGAVATPSAVAVPPPIPSAAAPVRKAGSPPASPPQDTLDLVLRELRSLRKLQERILDLLERSPAAERASSDDDEAAVSPIRARRQKNVVLIDDDPVTREAAVAEMMQADVPVRAFADSTAAVAAIADDKPDVIVLELELAGAMEGRDVINMVKATMEWVDIPIVLWTRAPVQNQKEARQVHGADEIVQKASGAAALVARVITLFRRVH